jgi:uncharacterized phiE125 gp8 family phage protein
MAIKRVVTNTSTLPVSLADMKEHLKVDGTAEDDYITSLIHVSRDYVEEYLNRLLVQRAVTEYFDKWQDDTVFQL